MKPSLIPSTNQQHRGALRPAQRLVHWTPRATAVWFADVVNNGRDSVIRQGGCVGVVVYWLFIALPPLLGGVVAFLAN